MDSTGNRSWKDMTPDQKKQYFMDYYLVKTLIGIAAVLFVIYVAVTVTRPKTVYALRMGVYNASLSSETKEAIGYHVQKTLSSAGAVEIDDQYNASTDADLMRIAALSASGKLDVIIADREIFEWLAGYGYFKDLSISFSREFYSSHEADIVVCNGLLTGEGGMLLEDSEGNGDPYAAGIRLTDPQYLTWFSDMKEPVLGIIYESDCTEKIETLLK